MKKILSLISVALISFSILGNINTVNFVKNKEVSADIVSNTEYTS